MGLGDVVKGLDVAKQILPAPSDAPPGIESAVRNAGGPDTGADALNASELTKIQGRGLLNAPPPVADPTTTMASTSTPLVPPPSAPGTSAAPGTSGGFNSGQDLIGANGSVTVPPVPRRSDLTFDQHREWRSSRSNCLVSAVILLRSSCVLSTASPSKCKTDFCVSISVLSNTTTPLSAGSTHSSSGPSVESVEQPWGYESVSPPCQDDFPESNSRLFNIDV